MASQAEILKFFEMMKERAARGEFRFVIVATVSHATSEVRATVAGMASQEEAIKAADGIRGLFDNPDFAHEKGSLDA